MKFFAPDHVYECLPPFLNNLELPEEEQIVIGLKGIYVPEMDAYKAEVARIRAEAYSALDAAEKIEKKNRELIGGKVVFIRGLEVRDFGEVSDFETFCQVAPASLVDWTLHAPFNLETLIQSDRCNFQQAQPEASGEREG